MKAVLAFALVCLLSSAFAAQQACTDAQIDASFASASAAQWQAQSQEVEFQHFRLQHLAADLPVNKAAGSGQGVALVVSTIADVPAAYVAATKMRAASALPIEIFHTGAIKASAVADFEALANVKVVELTLAPEASLMANAVLSSSFMDVLAVDARTVALSNPAALFESAEFQSKGLLMFPALHKTASTNPIWAVLGVACVDSFEQTAAVMVANKAKAWNTLHMASNLRSSFFKSMVNGEQNVMRLAAIATNTEFHMVDAAPRLAGANYHVEGVPTFCANLQVHSFAGAEVFAVSSNSIVEASGSTLAGANCAQGVSVGQDDALVSEHVQLFAALPESVSRLRNFACAAGTYSQAQIEAAAGSTFLPYKVDVSGWSTGDRRTFTAIPDAILIPQCGSVFSACSSGLADTTLRVAYVNITTGLTQSANVDVTTTNSANFGYGNSTYISVRNPTGTRTGCDYPFSTLETNVNYNLATGSWAIIAVSYDAVRVARNMPIALTVRYNGESSGALASALASPALVAIVALFAMLVQRF